MGLYSFSDRWVDYCNRRGFVFLHNIFEFVDNLIIVSDTIITGNKYDVFPCDTINNPITLTLRDKILENKNIDIGKVDSVNELIKAIYREIRW